MVLVLNPDQLANHLGYLPAQPRIVSAGSFATPMPLLRLLDKHLETYRLFIVNALPGIPAREGVWYETIFIGPGMRNYPRLDYYPCRLSLVAKLFQESLFPDIVVVQVSRPIAGRVSLGIEVQVLPSALEAVKARGGLVIAQINPQMPFTYGDGVLDLDSIDLAIEIENELPTAAQLMSDELATEVGARVAELIPNGATLQTGIGAVPNAVLHALQKHQGLRVWTELLTDGFLGLKHAGALDNQNLITASFAFGSREFYDWLDDNPAVRLLRCDYTNNPAVIAAQPQMMSVNTALQVDLFGSANATRINHQFFSGIGGQTDFFLGALHSPGGLAIMALKSWHPKANQSTIVDCLKEPTTSMQFSYVVTEYGAAQIFGVNQRAQSEGLIKIAHPRVQAELQASAMECGLL